MTILTITFRNNKNERKEFRWLVNDKPITQKWLQLLRGTKDRYDHPWDFWAVGHTPAHYETIKNSIIKISEKLNQLHGFDIPLELCYNLTQENLNILHLKFHEVAENLIRSIDDLDQLNRLVHNAETTERNLRWPNRDNYAIFTLNSFNKQLLVPNDYLEFDSNIIPAGSLTISYSTIGKSLLNCSGDNDLQLVQNKMVRPKITLSCEVKLSLSEVDQSADRMISNHYLWCEKHNVKQFGYDPYDPIHITKECVLALPHESDIGNLYQWAIDSNMGEIVIESWALGD